MTVLLDIRLTLLHHHGNFALAYPVTFQPGLEHLGGEAGFLSYKIIGSIALVLSIPSSCDRGLLFDTMENLADNAGNIGRDGVT